MKFPEVRGTSVNKQHIEGQGTQWIGQREGWGETRLVYETITQD